MFELHVRLKSPTTPARKHTKALICSWLERRGRTDFVDGVIDGVEDTLTSAEFASGLAADNRFEESPLALYDPLRGPLDELAATLTKRFAEAVDVKIHEIPDDAWSNCWQQTFEPWTSGRFFIFPRGRAGTEKSDLQPIEIDDQGFAFGTGQHRSTRILLGIMELNWSKWKPKSVLDVGCGTGILGIAAHKLGTPLVAATEIDEALVGLARANAIRNSVSMKVDLMAVPVFAQLFDVVIANILVPVLHDLMADMARCLKPGGILLLSGFVEKERDLLIEKAGLHGFFLESETFDAGWCGVQLRLNS